MPSLDGSLLQNICFTHDDWYVAIVVIPNSAFFSPNDSYRIRLITGFLLIRAAGRMPHLELDMLILPEHLHITLDYWLGMCFLSLVFYTVLCPLIFAMTFVSLFVSSKTYQLYCFYRIYFTNLLKFHFYLK